MRKCPLSLLSSKHCNAVSQMRNFYFCVFSTKKKKKKCGKRRPFFVRFDRSAARIGLMDLPSIYVSPVVHHSTIYIFFLIRRPSFLFWENAACDCFSSFSLSSARQSKPPLVNVVRGDATKDIGHCYKSISVFYCVECGPMLQKWGANAIHAVCQISILCNVRKEANILLRLSVAVAAISIKIRNRAKASNAFSSLSFFLSLFLVA